ncbi:Voltage-dependent P/Q-type calcium channel subunit alpha-1A [Symbiodinium microadriaticum]|uniref:Voltage-dependent P/Q-type calcium channel subunit alpha-1A n=1 Tax=Symbiodinium microadriaticum TaxID=2951 RepID=A0A1Q9DEE3_SYMMI|nr:Voltage-dependent P/Q-type calcium channel subunit alpha-1A [Symbiodinium microadriaticum]
MKKKRKGKKPKPSDNSAAAEDFLQEPVDAVQCLAWCGFFLFVDSVILDDWRAVLPRAVLQLQECPGMFQNDLETPTYEPEVWRSTTQGLGPLYTRRSTMAVVSTETRKTAATASSLREKSAMTSGDEEAVMAVLTAHQHNGDGGGLERRMEVAKAKLESFKESSTLRKVEEFLKVALGRTSKEEDSTEKNRNGSAFEVRWLLFEAVAAFMIFALTSANSVLLGWEVQFMSSNLQISTLLTTFSIVFALWFILEVLVRLRVVGAGPFFCNDDHLWNICDLCLVGVSIVELILLFAGNAKTPFSTIKAVKILRVVRLFRVFRFFRQLSTLALMVADSVKQLLWALVMFLLIMYVFAITLTSSCTDWLKEQVNYNLPDWEQRVMAGIHGEGIDASVEHVGRYMYITCMRRLSFCLMFAYIIFTILALMNVFTGVFVDNAVQNSKKQRKIQIEETIDRKRTSLDQIIEFFVATDLNGWRLSDGAISLDEIQLLLQAYFDMIGFRPGDASLLAELLDRDGSGDISLQEFIAGCERMKGEAKGIDVHMLLLECSVLNEKLDVLHENLTGQRFSGVRGGEAAAFVRKVMFEPLAPDKVSDRDVFCIFLLYRQSSVSKGDPILQKGLSVSLDARARVEE